MNESALGGSLRDMLKSGNKPTISPASPVFADALGRKSGAPGRALAMFGSRGSASDPTHLTIASPHQLQMALKDQPAVIASRHAAPGRGSVSVGFKVQKTKEHLQKAATSKDLHEMKAALAAASALAAIADIDFKNEEALVREAILAQGAHAVERMSIHDSSAIDDMVHKFWELMQRESIKADPDTPSDTVTRAGYEAVYLRINKCVWTQGEEGEKWDIAAAKADGQIDWELDINRFKENATINNWLRKIRCAVVVCM
jgi:hypothetical protein